MKKYNEQIERIKTKLSEAKATDRKLKVFGASSHKYLVNTPATLSEIENFEAKYSLSLPLCYKSFLAEIGNGGESYSSSAAGPFLGIFPLSKNIEELIYQDGEENLNNNCVLHPKMTDPEWTILIQDLENELTDGEFYEKIAKVYGGILPIGSQGCTYLHGLILNGDYKGKVVNLDMDRQKPKFTFENNFLDWYERWLDEVIDGTLLQEGPSWFGYSKGGKVNTLLTEYLNSTNDGPEKGILFNSLIRKSKVPIEETLRIESELLKRQNNVELLSLLTKFNYNRAEKHLYKYSNTNFHETIKIIYTYGLSHSDKWVPVIKSNIDSINNETYRFCRKILETSNVEFGDVILPLYESKDIQLKCSIINTLGNRENKKKYIDIFKNALTHQDKQVNRYALGALYNVKDKSLSKIYDSLLLKEFNQEDNSDKQTYQQLMRNIKFLDEATIEKQEEKGNFISRLLKRKK